MIEFYVPNIDLSSVLECIFEGFDKPDDQWSCKRSPEIGYILKYFHTCPCIYHWASNRQPYGAKTFS